MIAQKCLIPTVLRRTAFNTKMWVHQILTNPAQREVFQPPDGIKIWPALKRSLLNFLECTRMFAIASKPFGRCIHRKAHTSSIMWKTRLSKVEIRGNVDRFLSMSGASLRWWGMPNGKTLNKAPYMKVLTKLPNNWGGRAQMCGGKPVASSEQRASTHNAISKSWWQNNNSHN